jgi:hypothetical protein
VREDKRCQTRQVLTLAGQQISHAHALEHLKNYAECHEPTVRFYDYADLVTQAPAPSDGVQMSDVARLVAINSQLKAQDIKMLLEPVPDALWEAVPRNATFLDLPDNPLTHPTYLALVALYEAYSSRSGIKATKATKLLHLKRPYLMPIRDSVAQRAYRSTAEALAREFGQGKALYWSALWRDARRNAPAMTDLATTLLAGTANERLIGALSPLRLQDMLIWGHFRSPCTRSS